MAKKKVKTIFKGYKVLILDDEPDNVDVAKTLLEFGGADVTIGYNGQDGLDYLEHDLPTFILCDLSMPVMSGWEFLHAVRQNAKFKDIPVIALTAHVMVGDKERVLQAGFQHYIAKPIQPKTFLADLMKLVQSTNIVKSDTGN